ncbi:antirestriction protein [Duganella sp. BuS-21]|uniref:antirestriction protein n=1 Tax=Duganella sp. BuS-21 TaxID=2943848 RepID=UPI0035A62ED4
MDKSHDGAALAVGADRAAIAAGAAADGGAEAAAITATLVGQHERLGFLPRQFGPLFLLAENVVYDTMGRLCPHYTSGYWDFFSLSNGGAFLAPRGVPAFRLVRDGEGFDGWFDAETAGIGVTAVALCKLSFGRDGARFAESYYRLRDFIDEHPESRRLYALLD